MPSIQNSSNNPKVWLITGGAGYIGSHIAETFLKDGMAVVAYDSLENGLRSRFDYLHKKFSDRISFVQGDIRDLSVLESTFKNFKPAGIIHTAALKSVEKSIQQPKEYFDVNVQGTINLLQLAQLHGVKNIIFSSTAAVYGPVDEMKAVNESHPTTPGTPYGKSKLEAELEMRKYLSIAGNFGTSLRFFNVVGASSAEMMDNSRDNLVPITIEKIRRGENPKIFGDDYSTKDGTCIRDYIDVRDIAEAHLLAASAGKKLPSEMNVGSGSGTTVKDIVQIIGKQLYAENLKVETTNRRPGDFPYVMADTRLIKRELNFNTRYSITESISSQIN